MRLKTDHITIPPLVTRAQAAEILGITVLEVRRLDYQNFITRHPAYTKPVKYTGASIRDFAEGKI